MSQSDLRHYANVLRTHPDTDLGDERVCIQILRDHKIPEELITNHLEDIIEIARTL